MANTFLKKLATARHGISLIEMLVAIGIFSVIVSLAVGGFARALRTQRQATGLLSANSNASLAIEQMAREMRTGYDFCANGTQNDCSLPQKLTFRNSNEQVVSYCLYENAIERRLGGSCGTGENRITSADLLVQYLSFNLMGNLPSDGMPPRVTVSMGISAKQAGLGSNVIDMQTTISSRILD